LSKLWKKKHDNTKVKLETSKEINDRVTKSNTKFSKSHSILQSDLCVLLAINTGRRDKKWIDDFISLRNHCVKIDLWEGFVLKYNLHRGFTAEYC
jgi:hypothetical protein